MKLLSGPALQCAIWAVGFTIRGSYEADFGNRTSDAFPHGADPACPTGLKRDWWQPTF